MRKRRARWFDALQEFVTYEDERPYETVSSVIGEKVGTIRAELSSPGCNTGFVVVQTRQRDALKPIKYFGAELAKWIGIVLSPGLPLVAFTALRARKRALG